MLFNDSGRLELMSELSLQPPAKLPLGVLLRLSLSLSELSASAISIP